MLKQCSKQPAEKWWNWIMKRMKQNTVLATSMALKSVLQKNTWSLMKKLFRYTFLPCSLHLSHLCTPPMFLPIVSLTASPPCSSLPVWVLLSSIVRSSCSSNIPHDTNILPIESCHTRSCDHSQIIVFNDGLFIFFILFIYFLFVVNFVIHWNETAMGLHVFPIPIPPPTSRSTRSP